VLIGINNRDLRTFTVDLRTTRNLLAAYRDRLGDLPVVSESASTPSPDLQQLQAWGVRAVLVGEALVTQPDPGQGGALPVVPVNFSPATKMDPF
jgi:indole-3-glycerol phosphate synthase